MTEIDWAEVTRLRRCVETWIRIKFEKDTFDNELYRKALGDDYDRVVQQLRNDALHSGLLMRLFQGEEPGVRDGS